MILRKVNGMMQRNCETRGIVLLPLVLGLFVTTHGFGQVTVAAETNIPMDEAPYTFQVDPSTYQQGVVPNLGDVNSNADSVQYVDRQGGPFNLGLDFKGGWGDNLFDSAHQWQSGAFAGLGVPVGVRWKSSTSHFDANYRLDWIRYPGFPSVNDNSQVYTHQLVHNTSNITRYFWNATAGRLTSLGQYLPTSVSIGGTGVSQAAVGASSMADSYIITNAASSLGFIHNTSEKNKVTGSLTGGWLEEAQQQPAPGQPRWIIRNELAGFDLQFEHNQTQQSAIGAELTNVFLRGLAPVGHENYIAVEGTFRRNLSEHVALRAGVGPLFSLTNGITNAGIPQKTTSDVSYAANAGLNYSTPFARIDFGYTRVLQLQYLEPATEAHQLAAVFDRALTRSIDLTIDTRYVRTVSDSPLLRQSNFGVSARVDKHLTNNILLFASVSRSQQATPQIQGTTFSYDRDDVFGGVTVLLGNPLMRRKGQ
jgi:hypothetical protein